MKIWIKQKELNLKKYSKVNNEGKTEWIEYSKILKMKRKIIRSKCYEWKQLFKRISGDGKKESYFK